MSAFCAQLITVRGRHHGRDVAVAHEALARQVRHLDHVLHGLGVAHRAFMIIFARLGEHDLRLGRGGQIVERNDDVPAVHLALVDLLRAVIEARRVAKADRVGGGEQAEPRGSGGSRGSGRAGSACRRFPARAGSRTSRRGGPHHIRRTRARSGSAAPRGAGLRGTP